MKSDELAIRPRSALVSSRVLRAPASAAGASNPAPPVDGMPPTSRHTQGRVPAIVLGSGVTALGVIRSLGRRGVGTYGSDPSDPLLRASRWFRAPPGQPLRSDDRLDRWLRGSSIPTAVLIPCSDDWVSQVAELPSDLAARFVASVPAHATVQQFVDKGRFAQLLVQAQVPHPWSRAVATEADIDAVPDGQLTSAILKPRDSQRFFRAFGVKAFTIASRHDAKQHFARASGAGHQVILQDYIPGPGSNHFFVDGFIDREGQVRAIFVRRRLRMYPTDFGNSTFMVSVPRDEAASAVDTISALLLRAGYRGIFSAEFKRDPRDGLFKLLEVNARAWWFVEFATRCGVDVCAMAYADALGESVSTVERYAVGRTMAFPYYDYFACRILRRDGSLSRRAWARDWLGAMQPVMQIADPLPGLKSLWSSSVGYLGRSMRRRLGRRAP